MAKTLPLFVLAASLIFAHIASAQPIPLPKPASSSEDSGSKIEGVIWEFKATLKKDARPIGDETELAGRFRTEKSAVFDISSRALLPAKKDVDKAIDKAKEGKLTEIKLPPAPQQKRIGEYRKTNDGRLRLDLNDPESLDGVMVIWRKQDTADVWMGTYRQRKDKKFVQDWIVELRPVED
jgi:hypothetical protein